MRHKVKTMKSFKRAADYLMRNAPKYHGISYPKRYYSPKAQEKWKKEHCPKNEHLFDEVVNSSGEHYLVCDACGLYVHISLIETERQCRKRIRNKPKMLNVHSKAELVEDDFEFVCVPLDHVDFDLNPVVKEPKREET